MDQFRQAYNWLEQQVLDMVQCPRDLDEAAIANADAVAISAADELAARKQGPEPSEQNGRALLLDTSRQLSPRISRLEPECRDSKPTIRIAESMSSNLSNSQWHVQSGSVNMDERDISDTGEQVAIVNKNGKEAHALLLTSELLDTLRTNIEISRTTDGLDKKVRDLENALGSARAELAQIDMSLADLFGQKSAPGQYISSNGIDRQTEELNAKKDDLSRSIEKLQRILDAYQCEQYSTDFARKTYGQAFLDMLEKPLNQSGLLNTIERPREPSNPESIPVQLDHDQPLKETYSYMDFSAAGWEENSVSPSEEERLNLRQLIEEKENKIAECRHHLENFRMIYDRNLSNFLSDRANGVHNDSRTQFDHYHFTLKSQITRQLIEAEADLRTAKEQAREVGIAHAFDEESVFQSNINDGYAESFEEDMIHTAPRADIQAWQEDIPDEAYENGVVISVPNFSVDEWETESVEIGDSINCVGHEG
ncbi:hypothetical protein EV356DRAFT_537536 [Viridothelium virens]|uniref:Uncharacterized protein n=1 Tax=Viridothelium virens TaxID=1048519 RepID=A0A6A6GTH8_VIRVR|nr:hypothetical protein EV356DRAFT_537536 [Viridothelium virens]